MRRKSLWMRAVGLFTTVLLALPLPSMAQTGGEAPEKKLTKEELAQLVAPIALYPDELVSQILMASTYPLEIVQADRWVKKNKDLKGDPLAKALEKEKWDPSVKSLVNFPSVLSALSEKLDQTTKLGDAFLSQQKDVLDTIQFLRKKAYDAGNLKTSKEQKVVVEKETIVIQQADPQVIYVPSYSPTVVYGGWPYPAYPPYYYYPPPPPAYPAFHFAAGVAVGMAWGYAWGHANWHGGEVNINHNQNINVNKNIDRSKYKSEFDKRQGGKGNSWQHDASHRKGVAYKDGATAQKYGQSSARSAEARRDARGYGEGRGAGGGARPETGARGGGKGSTSDRSAAGQKGRADTARGTGAQGGRDSAFGGGYDSGSRERAASDRGRSSMQSSRSTSSFSGGGASRSSGGFGGGGGRGGGGGGRGGGGRR